MFENNKMLGNGKTDHVVFVHAEFPGKEEQHGGKD
jgi:hypothetical protein